MAAVKKPAPSVRPEAGDDLIIVYNPGYEDNAEARDAIAEVSRDAVRSLIRLTEEMGGRENVPKDRLNNYYAKAMKYLRDCQYEAIAPPSALIELFDELGGRLPELGNHLAAGFFGVTAAALPKLMKAIEVEAAAEPDPKGRAPSVSSVNGLARHAGVDRQTIKRWRAKGRYWDRIAQLRQGSVDGRFVPLEGRPAADK